MNIPSPSSQFARFLLASGFAALVNVGSRILLSNWIPYVPAILIAFCLGLMTAFALNKLFVFNTSTNRLHHQFLWFVAINLAAVAQTVVTSLITARWILPALHINYHNETIAHAIGVMVPAVTSYIGHKRLSFRA